MATDSGGPGVDLLEQRFPVELDGVRCAARRPTPAIAGFPRAPRPAPFADGATGDAQHEHRRRLAELSRPDRAPITRTRQRAGARVTGRPGSAGRGCPCRLGTMSGNVTPIVRGATTPRASSKRCYTGDPPGLGCVHRSMSGGRCRVVRMACWASAGRGSPASLISGSLVSGLSGDRGAWFRAAVRARSVGGARSAVGGLGG
jgi:hypothetical protein